MPRRRSISFGRMAVIFNLTIVGLYALKAVAGHIFAFVMAFVLFLILVCAFALTGRS